jgi:hypothetical protein
MKKSLLKVLWAGMYGVFWGYILHINGAPFWAVIGFAVIIADIEIVYLSVKFPKKSLLTPSKE